ncbi:4-alpha-glucanotransferase [Actinobacillus succinogenes]|uniref:4-alpha-glucanotransferase n=1 Tax=Actinobacillus succinogenes (strain ATCC 55618 / DSM 22257 / CCUG 43843 / 130Z) TaxID=339671 RepID=A6VP14_ACTSZ|nr:4-alpha-glucanotransferase [Actinobacillus succinogenes]ABR74711.1 4-alpha-glucanotransferase [Actinobacillus succinogenes 130Z]PHI40869.1 4-alpha-glucanotransferase [Actinobacillus succinogenes]
MMISQQQKDLAEQAGIAISHYSIDGDLVYASPETINYFTALLQPSVKSSPAQMNDVWVAVENTAFSVDLTRFFPTLPAELTCQLFNEQRRKIREDGVARGSTTILIPALAAGYYRLHLITSDQSIRIRLLVSPAQVYQPTCLQNGKVWGISVQLYSLRSERNWGIGDFADLQYLIERAVKFGADFIGISPLHQLYTAVPDWASPYSAASRRWLNTLYIAVDTLPEFKSSRSVQKWYHDHAEQISVLRQLDTVEYETVSALKMTALEQLFSFSRRSKSKSIVARRRQFLAFVKAKGKGLRNQALFQVLDNIEQQGLPEDENRIGWLGWRKEWQRLTPKCRRELLTKYADRVEFFMWLQWLAEIQLAEVQEFGRQKGMALGIYGDLAVQSSRGSADVWAHPDLYCVNASIGAPPDPLGPVGQNWNLPPYNPNELIAEGFEPFIELLRANMKHFGVLRIDHIMGLFRLWLIPQDKKASDGCYVYYPFEAFMAILAIESRRNQCLIVGEDLGIVSDEVRSKLTEFSVFSYFVLYFARQGKFFPHTDDFPRNAFATIGTHDLASLSAFWHCRDLDIFRDLQVLTDDELQQKYDLRVEDKQALLDTLHRDGYLPPDYEGDALSMAMHDHLSEVIHQYLAKGQSRLIGVQLENLIGQEISFNLPGTSKEYPNWRKKLAVPLEQIFSDNRIQSLLSVIHHDRHSK